MTRATCTDVVLKQASYIRTSLTPLGILPILFASPQLLPRVDFIREMVGSDSRSAADDCPRKPERTM